MSSSPSASRPISSAPWTRCSSRSVMASAEAAPSARRRACGASWALPAERTRRRRWRAPRAGARARSTSRATGAGAASPRSFARHDGDRVLFTPQLRPLRIHNTSNLRVRSMACVRTRSPRFRRRWLVTTTPSFRRRRCSSCCPSNRSTPLPSGTCGTRRCPSWTGGRRSTHSDTLTSYYDLVLDTAKLDEAPRRAAGHDGCVDGVVTAICRARVVERIDPTTNHSVSNFRLHKLGRRRPTAIRSCERCSSSSLSSSRLAS